VLAELLPDTRGFFVNAEMLARARQLGYDVAEVGVSHRPRLQGDSKVSLLDVPRTLRTLLPFWWSRVLFPEDESARRREQPEPALLLTLILCLVAGLLFFSRLACPLQEPQEARYAEIPRQMLAEGHWLVPVLHGQPYLDKPPLLYWLVMGSYQVFGVHDWSARLVSCAAAFLSVLVTFGWGRRVVGIRAAFAGALVLCLSARFIQLGRLLTMDSLLGLWVIAGWAAAHVACRGPGLRWGWWLLSAGACGLGLLTKGPVALVLVLAPVLAYQALDVRAVRPRLAVWGAYLAVAVGLACPWYILAVWHDPGFLEYFFWNHNVVRYVASFDHEEPLWFYLPGLLLGMLPWTLLTPPLARFLGRRSAGAAANRPAALGFFLLAFGWCLLFFSAAGCKRASYILPAMPPLALALGCYLDLLLPRTRLSQLSDFLAPSPTFMAQRATLLVLSLGAGVSLLAVIAGLLQPINGLVLATVAVAGFWIVFSRNRQRTTTSWALCGGVTFALLLVGVHQLLPSYARRFSMRGQIRPHVELCRDPQVPVLCYPRRWDSVSFYLNRSDVRAYTRDRRHHLIADLHAQPQALVFVKSDHSYKELLRDLPATLEFVPQGRKGNVTVGLVRHRREAPPGVMAERTRTKLDEQR
jgi:dolichol-phosphate mannosyltransferase